MDLIRREQEAAGRSRQADKWPLVLCQECRRLVQQAIHLSTFGDEPSYIFEFCGKECSRAAFQILRTAFTERCKAYVDLVNTTIRPILIPKEQTR